MSLNFVFIGAGNLATQFSLALKSCGFNILQVYSRTEKTAKILAEKLNSEFTTSPLKINTEADIYFVALKDSAVEEILPKINFHNKLIVHCSGSLPLSILEKYTQNFGVFYPLQTFSKERALNFNEIPIFIEANSAENEKILLDLAHKISNSVSLLPSGKRKYLHIAAVYANNFVNHFYAIAADILKSKDIPFDVLKPLILETALKIQEMEPEKSQTGPAVRLDENIISNHKEEIEHLNNYAELYNSISKSIFKHHQIKKYMTDFKEELKNVKAFVFDVDGVLSKDYSPLDSNGEPMRTANMKDGYAIKAALNAGFLVAIITGGISERVKLRYTKLGVNYYYDKVWNKLESFHDFLKQTGLDKSEILYMGDDILDHSVMLEVGVATCPLDAASDIKAISKYISEYKSGQGCVRDILEQTLRAQDKWFKVKK